jgi:hypothetical protein
MLKKRKIDLVEPGHIYTDECGNVYDSVTTIIKKYKPEFDAKFWARKKASELGMTPDEVIAMWEKNGMESAQAGTYKHYVGELLARGEDVSFLPEEDVNPFKEFFDKFDLWSETIFPEKRVYHPDWFICGTADALIPKGLIMNIYDYKTCKDEIKLEPGYWKTDKEGFRVYVNTKSKKFKFPIDYLPYSKGVEYELQMSIYMYILEHWGYVPGTLTLWQIMQNEDGKTRNFAIKCEYRKKEAELIINHYLETKKNGNDKN